MFTSVIEATSLSNAMANIHTLLIDESSDMKATHARRIQAGAAAATARQQATKEENSKLRNSAPQQDLEEEEEDGGGEYD